MDKTKADEIRFCAFCPNLCRTNYPTSGIPLREYMAPSALSYIGYAVLNDLLKYDDEIADVLNKLEAFDECKKACLYGYDIPSHLRALAADWKAKI
jgi:hypothetical protein